jgi:hypothetical protein
LRRHKRGGVAGEVHTSQVGHHRWRLAAHFRTDPAFDNIAGMANLKPNRRRGRGRA